MKNPPNIGVLIVDDQEMTHRGLKLLFEFQENIKVIGDCDTGESSLDFLENHHQDVDVVLMDVKMPGRGGIYATRRIKELYNDVAVIVFTSLDGQFRDAAMAAGAYNIMSKMADDDELIAEIMRAAQS